ISFVLFIFCWQSATVQVKEFGAIKPDSLRAIGRDSINILWKLDVGGEDNVAAIARRGRRFAKLFQLRHDFDSSRFDFAVTLKRFRRWIDNEKAVGSIEEHVLTGLKFFRDIVQADHRGNVERACHNRGTRSATAQIGGEPKYALPIHRRRVRWGLIVRAESVW